MANLNDVVRKQGDQIDGLIKSSADYKSRIEVLETQAMATAPEAPSAPTEVTVSIPEDVVRKSDLAEAVNDVKNVCKTITPKASSVYVSPMSAIEQTDLDQKIEKAVKNGSGDILNVVKTAALSNGRYDAIVNMLTVKDNIRDLTKRLHISVLVNTLLTVGCIGMIVWLDRTSEKLNHLERVEWLYRWKRFSQEDTPKFQSFEHTVLYGTDEQLETIKTKIFEGEVYGPQFYYFKPLDNWHPKPEEKQENNPPPAQSATSAPMPHEQKPRLTPGEVASIKAMRANPHIPDDAKPPLPEGYE